MIPSVAIAQERDPLSVWRRLRAAARIAGHAPERLLDVLVHESRLAARGRTDEHAAFLEVGTLAIEQEVRRIDPAVAATAETAAGTGVVLHRRTSGDCQDPRVGRRTRRALGDRVDDLRARVIRRL